MFWNIGFVVISILFFFGGLGNVNLGLVFAGVLISYASVYFLYLKKGKIYFPKGIKVYSLFLVFFLISLLWSKQQSTSLIYFSMFLSGGLFWVLFYNYKKYNTNLSETFNKLVIFLGCGFGLIAIYHILTKSTNFSPSSLTNYTFSNLNHHNIGDLWAAITGPLIYLFYKQKINFPVMITFTFIALFFLAISSSRSAYISLIVGTIYLISRVKTSDYIKRLSYIFIISLCILFVFVSMNKGLITHRLFYISGMTDTLKYPFGAGVGAFGIVLQENQKILTSLDYSNVAHNLLLDMLTGLGILSLPFFYWFYVIYKNLRNETRAETFTYRLFFLILTINFMFNYTYFIPVTLWLWFSALGMSQE